MAKSLKRHHIVVKLEGKQHYGCPGHYVFDGIISNLINGVCVTCDYCGSVFVHIPQPTFWQKLKGFFS